MSARALPTADPSNVLSAGLHGRAPDLTVEVETGGDEMRFLIADDHPLYRDAVRAQIERLFTGAIVDEVGSIDELYTNCAQGHATFDLFLLDLYMPGMSPEAVRRIIADFPDVAVAVISGATGGAMIRRCIEAGARGFIPKTATGEHLGHALQILLNGGTTVPAQALLAGDARNDPGDTVSDGRAESDVSHGPEAWMHTLNERELAVLRGVVRGQSNKQIAREIGIAEVTVKFHLRVLFRKIGVNRRAQVAVAGSRAGIA